MKLLPVLIAAQSFASLGVGVIVVMQTLSPPHGAAGPRRAVSAETPTSTSASPPGEAKHEGAAAEGDVVKALFAGNARFVADHPNEHHFVSERKALATGQHPRAMVLSCSDSRLPPELIFDQTLGELFVVRSAGNVADRIGLASLEYAAEHLGSKVLVVLGHEKCGAVTAAAKGGKMPTENLTALMDEISPSLTAIRARYQGDELVHFGVEANVAATADEVLDRSPVLKELVEKGELTVIQAVYDLGTGQVRLLAGPEHALAHVHASGGTKLAKE
jgi:carbonic anhydrase